MGKKIKFVSDPSLAKNHKKGSKVIYIQPSLNDQYGIISHEIPRYWDH